MAATYNLGNTGSQVSTKSDKVVIVEYFEGIRGGSTLNVTGFGPDVIKAGHVIIQETSTKEYKPMPLASSDTVYGTLPASHTYAGILVATILKSKPSAAIMVRGTVNPVAAPFAMTSILSAFKTAQPLILFRED